MNFSPSRSYALELDAQDELASFREQFVITDPDLLYMDGNSLGRLPKAAVERARQIVEDEWGRDLIRGWNKGWWEAPVRIGEKIARLIGAAQGQVIVSDTTSVNLYKLAMAALSLQSGKKRIITDTMNFPSDLYILQGCANFCPLSSNREQGLGMRAVTRSSASARRMANSRPISPRSKPPSTKTPRSSRFRTCSSKAATSTTCNKSPRWRIAKARSCCGT